MNKEKIIPTLQTIGGMLITSLIPLTIYAIWDASAISLKVVSTVIVLIGSVRITENFLTHD